MHMQAFGEFVVKLSAPRADRICLDKSQKPRWLILGRVCPASVSVEHVATNAHAIDRHEQLASEDLVIEEAANVIKHTIEYSHALFINDIYGKQPFTFPAGPSMIS